MIKLTTIKQSLFLSFGAVGPTCRLKLSPFSCAVLHYLYVWMLENDWSRGALIGIMRRPLLKQRAPRRNQGNLKSTRKARLSPFLSLYFWHKPIRLQQGRMRGRWSQILSFPSHSPWFYTAAALQRKNLGEGERWKQIRLQQPSAGIQCYCTGSVKTSGNRFPWPQCT